ncbi:MAG: hypothetical protein HY525_06020 [Betaproteobacteria bacterium]|nr:hypothetical protein [Betaproteobacteria bacterium]
MPFILGRPLGVPGDFMFQRRVLLAALRLLEAPEGPELADYPEEAVQPSADAIEGMACPVSFGGAASEGDLGAWLAREIEELAPWHNLAQTRRGRTTVGLSGVPLKDAARIVASYPRGEPAASFDGMSPGETLKLVCEDIRAYYFEAAAAQPGALSATAIQHWFWHDTAAGRAFLALHKTCLASTDESLRLFGSKSLVPNIILRSLSR